MSIHKITCAEGQGIITGVGYKRPGDLMEGDCLLSYTGDYGEVKGVNVVGEGKFRLIKVNGLFLSVPMPLNSYINVYRGRKEDRCINNSEWVNVQDINTGDMIVFPCFSGIGEENRISCNSLVDVAKFLGYYTLNGYIKSRRDKVFFHIDKDFPFMKRDIMTACKNAFGLDMDAYTYQGEDFVSVKDDYLVELCGTLGDKNREKVLPEWLVRSDPIFLTNFLDPFLKLNKDKKDNYFRPSASLNMFMGFQRILFSLNCFSNIHNCLSRDEQFSYYALIINKLEMERIGHEEDSWFKKDNTVFLKIIDVINSDNPTKIYEITVDGSDSACSGVIYFKDS